MKCGFSPLCPGLSKTLFPRWETLVKHASLLYFGMFKRQTVDYFNKSIDTFWNTPVTTPALFFFCENDPLSNPRAMEDVIDHWRKCGINTTAKKWEDSTHAGHLKRHQQEYLTTLNMFLHSLHFAPLKAKMWDNFITTRCHTSLTLLIFCLTWNISYATVYYYCSDK